MLSHNFGHYAASLHHLLGTMSVATKKALKYDDVVSQRMAERQHILKDGGRKSYRIKRKYNPKNGPIYESGFESIT